MALTATQRARMTARLGNKTAMAAVDAEAEAADDEPSALSGVVGGTDLDWESSLYLDDQSHELFDGGDREAREVRDALRSDWKMRQLALVLTQAIKGADWKLTPHKDDTGEAEDTEEKLRRPANAGGMTTPIRQVLAQASSSIYYKRAYFAKGKKLDAQAGDGSVMWSQLAFRPASTCRLRYDPQDTGRFAGFAQDVVWWGDRQRTRDGKPALFSPSESLVFINGTDQDPVSGASDLEVAMWCWRTKRRVMLLALDFLAAYSLPRTLVGYTDGDEGKAKKAAQMIAKLKSSGVGYYDKRMMSVDSLDLSGKGMDQFLTMLHYLDSCASGSVLAGFTDLTSAANNGVGSFALSADARDTFGQTRQFAADGLAETMTNYCVADLVRYNYGVAGRVPTFTFEPLAGVDDAKLLALLTSLATAQSTVLPTEFVNELALHAAKLFDIDVDKVRTALQTAAEQAAKAADAQQAGTARPNPAAAQAAAAGAAVDKVRQIAAKVAAS